MSCCAPLDYHGITEDINGKCPDCGEQTVDGEAAYGCEYSPEICETCGYKPRDESC